MLLRDILLHKGTKVYSIEPDATLAEVVRRLVDHNCGSLVVCHRDNPTRLLGIITERDILRACAAGRVPLERHDVATCMTSEVVTVTPGDSVAETMGLMTEHRIRHLPIVDGDELVGIVSIGDIVKAQHDALTMENFYLKTYIQG
jgi:CBS domain-containing protein